MQNAYLTGTPQSVLSAISRPRPPRGAVGHQGLHRGGEGGGPGVRQPGRRGGEGGDTGRELAAAIEAARSVSPHDVKGALEHQALATGGIQRYSWQRWPNDYPNITQIDSAVVTAGASGSFKPPPARGRLGMPSAAASRLPRASGTPSSRGPARNRARLGRGTAGGLPAGLLQRRY